MAKKEALLTVFGVTQQLRSDLWLWTDEERAIVENGSAKQISDIIVYRLQSAGYVVESFYGIIHDQDTREVWDDTQNRYVLETKPRHFHGLGMMLKHEGKLLSGTLPQLATAVGVEGQYIEKAPRGKYGYDNMLAYLIHIKYTDKHLYQPTEVYSTGAQLQGPDGSVRCLWTPYTEIYAERKKEWETGKAAVQKEKAELEIDSLEESILLGEYTKNQILLTDELYAIYARNKRRCDDAFDTYAERKIAKTIQAMENGEFKLTVYFITGKSHSGKSWFTDTLVERLVKDAKAKLGQDWTVATCAASNPFDEYQGQEILVMDDLRGAALTASDWLKLLDPDRANLGSARYHNKRVACRAIIINSEKDVLEFFYYVKGAGGGNRSEAMDQFFRRILARVVVYRVPETSDERRLLIGHMRETEPYELGDPSAPAVRSLTLEHDFKQNELDLGYEEALEYLSGVVMERNIPTVEDGEGEGGEIDG